MIWAVVILIFVVLLIAYYSPKLSIIFGFVTLILAVVTFTYTEYIGNEREESIAIEKILVEQPVMVARSSGFEFAATLTNTSSDYPLQEIELLITLYDCDNQSLELIKHQADNNKCMLAADKSKVLYFPLQPGESRSVRFFLYFYNLLDAEKLNGWGYKIIRVKAGDS